MAENTDIELLFDAIQNHDLTTVTQSIRSGVDLTKTVDDYCTALHLMYSPEFHWDDISDEMQTRRQEIIQMLSKTEASDV